MADYDLLIKGGTVIDGTGGDRFTADVAVKDGKIVEVGQISGAATRTLDANGLLVTPGFVDIHTHYDGQVSWDPYLTPSSWHGVTTAVMGNCGVGFAPAAPERHDWLIALMEGVEDIPGAALAEGIDWQWESFPEYLDAVAAKPHAIDFGAQVPHGALRAYVMGERGANREASTDEDRAAMAKLTAESIAAGALGFTTSRTMNHRSRDGDPTPTLGAAAKEIWAIAEAMGKQGQGVLQFVSDFIEVDEEFDMMAEAVRRSGRPASISVVQADVVPGRWRDIFDRIETAQSNGLVMRGQVAARPVGLILGLQASFNPFVGTAAYKKIADLPLAERVAEMRKPEVRNAILTEQSEKLEPLIFQISRDFHKLFELGNPPEYEPTPDQSLAARAQREGVHPKELCYDLMLGDEGRALLYFPVYNFTGGSLDVLRQMLTHDHALFGLGDGGAHCGVICDGSFPTTMLTHWTRDRAEGRLPLEYVIRGQTRKTAEAVGLYDRGLLKPGMKADINLIDYDNLRLHTPSMAFDLPANGRRLVQGADGYRATIVSGQVISEDGAFTGALPGQLVRGSQSA